MFNKKRRFAYLLIMPAVIVLALLTLAPMFFTLYMSFFKWNPYEQNFTGLENYLRLFLSDRRYRTVLKNTIFFMIGATGLELIFGFLIASLLNRTIKGQGIIRTLFILPMVITPVVTGMTWRILLNPTLGTLSYLLRFLGLSRVTWFSDPSLALVSLVFVDVWQWTPFMMLILLAGLQSLPVTPFEAAQIDGASSWQTFRFITLPMLKPIIIIALSFRIMDTFKIFDIIFAITRGGPGTATETVNIYAFLTGFSFYHLGYASAQMIIMVLITILISYRLLRSMLAFRREGERL